MTEPLQTKRGQRGASDDPAAGDHVPEIRGLVDVLPVHAATIGSAASVHETGSFELEEATIADIHHAMRDGRLTCRALALMYLQRIQAYSVHGPQLNA